MHIISIVRRKSSVSWELRRCRLKFTNYMIWCWLTAKIMDQDEFVRSFEFSSTLMKARSEKSSPQNSTSIPCNVRLVACACGADTLVWLSKNSWPAEMLSEYRIYGSMWSRFCIIWPSQKLSRGGLKKRYRVSISQVEVENSTDLPMIVPLYYSTFEDYSL
jgi:hypothetical protein